MTGSMVKGSEDGTCPGLWQAGWGWKGLPERHYY